MFLSTQNGFPDRSHSGVVAGLVDVEKHGLVAESDLTDIASRLRRPSRLDGMSTQTRAGLVDVVDHGVVSEGNTSRAITRRAPAQDSGNLLLLYFHWRPPWETPHSIFSLS
jgi:hypothetical protein